MQLDHLVVVMPAYNEAEGLPGFLAEIDEHLAPLAVRLSIVVVDDRSTDETFRVLRELEAELPALVPIRADENRGHGPSALAAYRAGLERSPDLVLHVDGDGQFHGSDLAKTVRASVSTSADVVHGVRRGRGDPWFRRALTFAVGVVVWAAVGRRVPDVNTPLRAYRPAPLAELLAAVPTDALVPHVHFSLAEVRRGYSVRYVEVASLPRRGSNQSGTMWGVERQPKLPPKRLRRFAVAAAAELWRVSLRPGAAR
ncbi:glycosyltransferase family 2 protein [Agromyces sp. GXQ0307]|uniref:glycosyltransferase family 2 protein n=1 Tax=Agromyces sp. GXQ0307 TaxID=3377835 RepID=UPI00383B31D7